MGNVYKIAHFNNREKQKSQELINQDQCRKTQRSQESFQEEENPVLVGTKRGPVSAHLASRKERMQRAPSTGY